MTTDEVRASLLAAYRDDPDERTFNRYLDALIAAVRAEYAEWVDPYRYETDTAMDYGHGLRDGRAESAETLRALRQAVSFLTSVTDSGERLTEQDRLALRAALAATPAEAPLRWPDMGPDYPPNRAATAETPHDHHHLTQACQWCAADIKALQDEARAEAAQELAALREAAVATVAASDAHDGSLFDALLALRAALAATPAEDGEGRT